MRVQLNRRDLHADEAGAVAVVVALVATVLLVLSAFVADFGNAWAQSRQLSVAADAAALAAARSVGQLYTDPSCTDAGLAAIDADSVATAQAVLVNSRNDEAGHADTTDTVTAHASCSTDGHSILVDVSNSRTVPTGLGALVGVTETHPNATATAAYVRTVVGMLRPWAVCDSTVADAEAHPSTTYAAPMDNWWGVCGTDSSGNWGAVDFNGGGNPATDLTNWTRYGYTVMPTIPGTLPADPGVSKSGLPQAFTAIVNTPILVPVVTNYVVPLSGNNGTFQTSRLALVTFCGAYYQGKAYSTDASGNPSPCWVNPYPVPTPTSTSSATGGAMVKGSATLSVTLPVPFFTDSTWVNNPNVLVTVSGADSGGKDLTSTIAAIVDPQTVTLATSANTTVSNATVTVTTYVMSTPPAPLDSSGKAYDQLQFRFLRSYATSADASVPCDLNDTLCHGVVTLYK